MASASETTNNTECVYYDLEASGLHEGSEILQIGAVRRDSSFDVYITPTQHISDEVSALIHLQNVDGKLLKNGVAVNTVPLATALTRFCDFLERQNAVVHLVAHGGHRFDHPRICRAMRDNGLGARFSGCVSAFCDTFWVFKYSTIFYRGGLGLQALARYHRVRVGTGERAHDALSDARLLQAVCDRAALSGREMMLMSKTYAQIVC